MKEKINKRTTKDSIEYLELQCIVNNRIHDYVAKYHNYPKYIKLPLWIFECLKQTMCEVDLKIDYTTEEYWTWDYVEEEKIHVDKFNFLGVDFDYDTIEFYNQSYNTTKEVKYHIRYKYYTIPIEFEGTLFTYINNNTITQNK